MTDSREGTATSSLAPTDFKETNELPHCPSCKAVILKNNSDQNRTICNYCGSLLPNAPRAGRASATADRIRLPRVPSANNQGRGALRRGLVRFFHNLRQKSSAGSSRGWGRRSGRQSGAGGNEASAVNSDDEEYFNNAAGEDIDDDMTTDGYDRHMGGVGGTSGLRKACSVTNLPPITQNPTRPSSIVMSVNSAGISSSSSSRTSSTRGTAGYGTGGHQSGVQVRVRPFQTPNNVEEQEETSRIIDQPSFESELKKAREAGNFTVIGTFYTSTFNSFHDMNMVFRIPPKNPRKLGSAGVASDSEIDLDFVGSTMLNLPTLPNDVQKSVLKAVINCLLSDQRNADVALMKPVCRDDLRAYLILSQNPQFKKPSTYVVYSHLLRQIGTLCDIDHQTLADWFSVLSARMLKEVVACIHQFIAMRLFPTKPHDLPPMSKCSWWIPCAVKNLAILNAANDVGNLLPFTDFYNEALDHWDLMGDFQQWQTPTMNAAFSFCQYPFILSISAKKTILEGNAEQQMIATARDSIIGTLAVRRTPDMEMLFLILTIRRAYLLEDSLNEISKKQAHLRKKLRINFVGEPGLDMGGLKKEWFQLLTQQIFNPNYGMFVYYPESQVYWFSTMENVIDEKLLKEYHLVGVLMGLAVYNGAILDIRFPLCCYKKLLSPPVTPRILDIHNTPLGVTPLNLEDLAQITPTTAKSLQDLLDYEGDVEEDFGLSFQVGLEEFGVIRTIDLKENGADIPVTKGNRNEYVKLYINWFLNDAMGRQFKAFYLGFHSVCSTNLLLLLRPEEIELLVCGCQDLDLGELKRVTVYDGYFWDLILKLPPKHQKRLLLFVTGSDRIPASGMREMVFKISKMISSNPALTPQQMLPMAHTCFNQLILPDYQNRTTLRQKLAVALSHGEGFGLE